MILGARTLARGHRAMICSASPKCFFARAMTGAQARPSAGLARNLSRLRLADARRAEIFAWQVEPAEGCVLVEIAQNVGELERAAKMMREALTFPLRHSESPRGKASDRARHAIAIKIERGQIGRPYIGIDIHLHAIDHGTKILAPQSEGMDCHGETSQPCARAGCGTPAYIKRADIAPPFGERLLAGVAWPRFVRDVVNGAAEGIDFKHRLAARAWQNTHGRIEGTAARPGGRIGWLRGPGHPSHETPIGVAALRRGREKARSPSTTPMLDQARAPDFVKCTGWLIGSRSRSRALSLPARRAITAVSRHRRKSRTWAGRRHPNSTSGAVRRATPCKTARSSGEAFAAASASGRRPCAANASCGT